MTTPAPSPATAGTLQVWTDLTPATIRHVHTLQRIARGLLARRKIVRNLRSRLSVRCAACLGRCTASLPAGVRQYLPWHTSKYDH